jgi:peptidoglycan/xylan/chitin deacetylase (PgdA/CDA1 family)
MQQQDFNSQTSVRIKSFLKSLLSKIIPLKKIIWCRRSAGYSSVALTFDDGPNSTVTPKLLDTLDKFNAKATFFVVGNKVNENIELLRRIHQSGHQIGNHSFSHRDIAKLTENELTSDLESCEQIFSPIVGIVTVFRPPYGVFRWSQLSFLWKRQITIALWNIDSRDFEAKSIEEIRQNVSVDRLRGGDIILFHDSGDHIVGAISELIPKMQQRGLKLATVNDIILGI